jgi:hypothetical protein
MVIGAAASAAPASSRWTWRSLHRPFHLPTLTPGASCPVSARTRVDLGTEGIRALPGRGPAYPNLPGDGVRLEFVFPPDPRQIDFYGTGWGGNKVLWWVTGTYHGPVLIRGRELGGNHVVRFDTGRPLPPKEIRVFPGRGHALWKGARDRPSYTRLQTPGCYAYQLDGTTFSRVVVFEAEVVPSPGG